MKLRNLIYAVLFLILAANIGGCGGGGGGAAPVSTTVVTKGVVESLGSVTVNGIKFETAGATVRIDDNPGTEGALKRGMVVKVKGTFDDRTGTGTATEVEFEDNVQGRVESIDNAAKTITVLGQTVQIEDNITRLSDDDTVKTFAGAAFSTNDIVEVSGFPDDKGGLRATRVARLSSGEFEIKGFVSNASASTFTLKVTPTSTTSFTVTLGTGVTLPANGAFVEVRTDQTTIVGGNITAKSIEVEDAKFGADNEQVRVEGLITSGSATSFVINGQTITTSSTTVFENGTSAEIGPNVKVQVEGAMSGTTLVAAKVSFRSNIRIEADVTDRDLVAGTLTLLGKTVTVINTTELKEGGTTLALSDILVGNHVEVRARLDNSGNLVATRITRQNASTKAFLQGPVTAKDTTAGTVTILGITIATNASTEFRKVDDTLTDKATFFGLVGTGPAPAPLSIVRAKWDPFSAVTAAVKELELEGGR